MSNSFFDWPASGSRFVNFNVLTGDDLNSALDSVSTGLDKLPTPAKVNGGYANYAAATGSANAFVVALSSQITALADGLTVRFKANAANTGAATINVNSLGAKAIVRPSGAALEASDIANGQIVEVCYDSTNDRFQLQAIVSGAAAPASTFSGTAGATVDLLTGAAIASASTINLTSATGNRVHVTGTTDISAVTLNKGPRTVVFDDSLTLTHHATNHKLPGGINIKTAAGDVAVYESDGTTVWMSSYSRAISRIVRSGRTANTILAAGDMATLIDITSGTFSQTFTAAATLGAGWWCYIRNSGTGDITLDPNASETIDGLTSFVMYPGEVRMIQCDGSALRSVVLQPFYRAFTASGTFTKPPGYSYFGGLIWGAGGSGGKSTSANVAGGGGGGCCLPFSLPSGSVAATETVTIAAASAGATVAGIGAVGGNSTFGSLATGYGGGAGGGAAAADCSGGGGGGALAVGGAGSTTAASAASGPGGAPAYVPSGGTEPTSGGTGFGGGSGGTGTTTKDGAYGGGGGGGLTATAGGRSVFGGGGGGAGLASPGSAGTSVFGGAGGAGGDAASGADGTAPGGAGGGTRTGAKGGDGARGELRIWGLA